jgi:hypothetical protein
MLVAMCFMRFLYSGLYFTIYSPFKRRFHGGFTSVARSASVALEKNPGYKFLLELARIFRGDDVPEYETKMEEINYKYEPITSCEVERSFSTTTINYPTIHTHFPSNNNDPSTIDYLLLKNITNYTRATTITAMKSDHDSVRFSIDDIPRKNITKSFTSYKNTNWKNFRHALDKQIKINNINLTAHWINSETKVCCNFLQCIEMGERHTAES